LKKAGHIENEPLSRIQVTAVIFCARRCFHIVFLKIFLHWVEGQTLTLRNKSNPNPYTTTG